MPDHRLKPVCSVSGRHTEMLKCPADLTHRREGGGYKTIAEHLEAFGKIGCLPRTLNLSRLDEGEGIEAVFRLHAAKWHDYCRLHYNKSKLQRAEKRRAPLEDDPGASKSTRQSTEHALPSTEKCFFCDQSGEVLCVMHQNFNLTFM